jgi:hypothetical protein
MSSRGVSLRGCSFVTSSGWAPHLDLEPLAVTERGLLAEMLSAPWLQGTFLSSMDLGVLRLAFKHVMNRLADLMTCMLRVKHL